MLVLISALTAMGIGIALGFAIAGTWAMLAARRAERNPWKR